MDHLTALPIDLHIHIFSNLQPYDILQVGQTCKALYLASLQRVVWMDVLHRICVENTLFEPSFPITSMSVLELQRASMGPYRWIARTSSKERNSDGVLPHSITTYPVSAMPDLSIADLQSSRAHELVPGGRYIFALSDEWLALWDLGSPYSSSKELHMIASVPVEFCNRHLIHLTPDGMGLRIFICCPTMVPPGMASFRIYEIYPQSTSPQLTQISSTHIPRLGYKIYLSLSYDRLIFVQWNTLTVWDYKANTWARWGIEGNYNQVLTTKSAVMLIRSYGVSVWEIPPLLPESSLSMSTDPSIIPPVFELYYPENRRYSFFHQVPCDWYSGDTSQPIYYDVKTSIYTSFEIHRFEIIINSTISGGTLNLIKTFELPPVNTQHFTVDHRICHDKNVTVGIDYHTGFLATHVADIYDKLLPSFLTPLCHHRPTDFDYVIFCPVTGRVVYRETVTGHSSSTISCLDFLSL